MKIWPWRTAEDYTIHVSQGTRKKWRWTLLHNGDAVALSPVKGWDTAEEARDAARTVLDGIGAAHVAMEGARD